MAAPPSYVTTPQGGVIQQMVTTQPGAVVVGAPEQPRRGNWKGLTVTGIIQIVLGSLTVILGIVSAVAITSKSYFSDGGAPIWCGFLFYCIAGTLGIVAGARKSPGVSIAYMVMSILACLSAFSVAATATVGLGYCAGSSGRYNYYPYSSYRRCYDPNVGLGVYSVLLLLAIAEFVVSIVGASLTCTGICATTPAQHTVINYQAQPHVVVAGQPQGAVLVNNPPGQQQWGAYPPQQLTAPAPDRSGLNAMA